PYNLDSVATWVDWAGLQAANADVQTFVTRLLAFRAAHAGLRSGPRSWQRANGAQPDAAYWADAANTYLGFEAGDVFVAWSWGTARVMAVLPGGKSWALAGDSGTGMFAEVGMETAVAGP